MAKIFISYRREDSQHAVDRIYEGLRKRLKKRDIFMDVDHIPKGVDFVEYLSDKVAASKTLLAVIGPQWLTVADSEGRRRLDDPDDFVRVEIAAALRRGIPVVPVLLDGTPMPSAAQLPEDMRGFERRNAAFVDRRSLKADVDALVRDLGYGSGAPRAALTAAAASLALIGGVTVIDPFGWRAADTVEPSPNANNSGGGVPEDLLVETENASTAVPEQSAYAPGDFFRDCADCPEMVVIPSGEFLMGSPESEAGRDSDEGPQRTVQINYQFAVGKTEVTVS